MKAGLLLRIGIHLLGIWAIYTAITTGVYQAHLMISIGGFNVRLWFTDGTYVGGFFAYFVFPLLFAFCAFAFAGRIQRALLGPEGDAPLARDAFAPIGLWMIGCKILGLYLIADSGAGMIATMFEMVALRAGGGEFSESQVTSDIIANVVGIVAGVTLARRTEWVVRWCGALMRGEKTEAPP